MMTNVADAVSRWMCFAGALSGLPLGCPSSVLARHWRSSGATNASSLGRSIELRLVFRGGGGAYQRGSTFILRKLLTHTGTQFSDRQEILEKQ